jgi:acetyltransferase
VTGFANSESFPEIMDYLVNEPEVGTLVVASAGADSQAEQVIAQRDRTLRQAQGEPKAVAFLWTGSRGATTGLGKLKAAHVPVFYTPNRLASGLRSLLDYHAWRDQHQAEGWGSAPPINRRQEETLAKLQRLGRATLSEHEGKELIAAWDIPITRELQAASAREAMAAARSIGYPVALKVDSPHILHKTEAGAIRLNLSNDTQVRAAFAEIMANAKAYAPTAAINGALVQEMVPGGVEVIVGVSYDDQLGPVLLFGSGGVLVEVYHDVALRHCPVTRSEALAMVSQVKGARLLQGFRGRPAADVEALAETLVRVSHLAVNLEGTLAELDINPLMVLPAGQGVKAADALAVFKG